MIKDSESLCKYLLDKAQVAVSMKDVLRETKELKPAFSDPTDETSDEASMLE